MQVISHSFCGVGVGKTFRNVNCLEGAATLDVNASKAMRLCLHSNPVQEQVKVYGVVSVAGYNARVEGKGFQFINDFLT